jgi:5-methylcytosine-specific restriction endonuclease McrA
VPTVEWVIFEIILALFRFIWNFIWVPDKQVIPVEPTPIVSRIEPVIVKPLPVKRKRKPLPYKLRFEIFKRDNFTCRYCGRKPPEVILKCDHIIPVASGGTDHPSNLITSCEPCNGGKGDVLLVDNSYLQKHL